MQYDIPKKALARYAPQILKNAAAAVDALGLVLCDQPTLDQFRMAQHALLELRLIVDCSESALVWRKEQMQQRWQDPVIFPTPRAEE
jgi:hypothetical protein